jgi:hypothetical protein
VLDKTISRRIALERPGAPQLVRGYDVALGEILGELAGDLAQAAGCGSHRRASRGVTGPATSTDAPPNHSH